jgi:anthranilate/para-aminobenzoate synthase component II
VPNPFEAARYHSLVVTKDDLPRELELIGWTEDDLVMAAQHRELPRFGVQFHPESILTPAGPMILRNFLALAEVGTLSMAGVDPRSHSRAFA